jgi:hypothetical protein
VGFGRLDTGIVGSSPAQGMNVCLRFSVLNCLVQAEPCDGLAPVEGVQLSVKKYVSETSIRGGIGSARTVVPHGKKE